MRSPVHPTQRGRVAVEALFVLDIHLQRLFIFVAFICGIFCSFVAGYIACFLWLLPGYLGNAETDR